MNFSRRDAVQVGQVENSSVENSSVENSSEENLPDAQANLLGWCLIKPRTSDRGGGTDSLAVLLRRVRYAQYYNKRSGRTGHVREGCRQKTARFRLTHFVP